MKKNILVALVVAFMTLMASSCCFADVTGVTNTSKEGSLLIWPLIDTSGDNETYIVITNSANEGNETLDTLLSVKCYWEAREYPYVDGSGNGCPVSDAVFTLSMHNPLIFKASDGTNLDGTGIVPGVGPGMKGILKCWAVTPNETNQISWNHLSGYAIVLRPGDTEPKRTAFKYSAWRFAANVVTDNNGTTFADGFWVGKTIEGGDAYNTMRLWGAADVVSRAGGPSTAYCTGGATANCCRNGGLNTTTPIKMGQTADGNSTYYCIQKVDGDSCPHPYEVPTCDRPFGVYDACPSYLTFDFLAEPSPDGTPGHATSYLALAPCKEDLRADGDDATGQLNLPTRLSFSVWNENEVKYTGTYSCANCNGQPGSTYDVALADLNIPRSSYDINYFQQKWLHTDSGRFRVEGLATGKCAGAVKTPLVGVMVTRLIDPIDSIDLVATGGTASGPALNKTSKNAQGATVNSNPAYIKWDLATVPWKPKR